MDQPAWLDAAWAELGVHESEGAADDPRVRALFRDAGHPGVRDDEVAWCAAYVGACLERSGVASTRSLSARSYLDWGERIDVPRIGAVAVLGRGGDPSLGHVGFVVGRAGERVVLLGGNQGNAVTVQAFAGAGVLALRWPRPSQPAPEPASGDASGFEAALAHVLEMEGGWSNDSYDPGGPTNFGVTLAVYADYKHIDVGHDTIAALTAELKRIPAAEVRDIYRTRYWVKAACDGLPAPIALMHFDAAVNHGVGAAARMLQQALGVGVDGAIGPVTRSAIAACQPAVLIGRYAEIRRSRYRSLHHFWRFGRGWLARVDRTLERARALIDQPAVASAAIVTPEPHGDTTMSETSDQSAPAKWWGESLTIWGALVTALATVLPALGPVVGLDITAELVRQLGEQAVRVVQAVAGLAGTLAVIWGRTRATTRLTRREMTIHL